MKLVIEDIHGNSKASEKFLFGKQITVAGSWQETRTSFTELYDFFTQSFGPSIDVDTQLVLSPRPKLSWSYQLEHKYGRHKFFVTKDCKAWFLLKYSHQLINWS